MLNTEEPGEKGGTNERRSERGNSQGQEGRTGGVQLKNQQEKTGAPSALQSSLSFLPVFAPSRL